MQVSDAQKNVGSNHAVSGLKFKILRHFLQLGYSVLLSDVDIVTIQNPFDHLHRDSDVEGMSDGWDNATAYGEPLQHVSIMPQSLRCFGQPDSCSAYVIYALLARTPRVQLVSKVLVQIGVLN